jgi:hypothetical protein
VDDLTAFMTARLDEKEQFARAARLPAKNRARLLREVEAQRNILARYADTLARMEDDDYPAGVARDQAREYEDFVLPNLAAIDSDHPDYDQEWEP